CRALAPLWQGLPYTAQPACRRRYRRLVDIVGFPPCGCSLGHGIFHGLDQLAAYDDCIGTLGQTPGAVSIAYAEAHAHWYRHMPPDGLKASSDVVGIDMARTGDTLQGNIVNVAACNLSNFLYAFVG